MYKLVALSLSLLGLANQLGAVIVDGENKPEISATNHQSSELSSIDAFNTKACGIADPNFMDHEFINMAREGQFPWMVSFQLKLLKNITDDMRRESLHLGEGKVGEDLHFCTGSFISDRWILSAAHCFAPELIESYLHNNQLKVVAGSHKVSSRASINRNLTIKRIYIHSNFDMSMPVGFDISLVELENPVEFSLKRHESDSGEQNKPFINTICLPLKDKIYKVNESARIAGWGLSNEKDLSSMPSKLLTTDILLDKTEDCVKNYTKSLNSDKPKRQMDKYNDFICASYRNTRDSCQSDSGGPLMQYASKKAVAIGIVSYGIGCATKGVSGLYTRTSAYISWIKDITKNGKEASVSFRVIEASKDKSNGDKPNKSKFSGTTKGHGRVQLGKDKDSELRVSSKPKIAKGKYTTTTSTLKPRDDPSEEFKFFDEA